MRILLIDSNHKVLQSTLELAGHTCDAYWHKSAAELKALLPQYDACVIRSKFKIDKELLDQCKNLKCIGRVGAGMENIDHSYARSVNIACVNAPEGNRDAVGEHALGMLLMLLNNIKKADLEVRRNIWLRAENRGTEICGKTVGIIGYGNMGSSFAKKLSGLDCRILVYDKYRTDISDSFAEAVQMDRIFAESDIVSLHVPLTPETHYLLNASFFAAFQKSIYVINTARGKCLHTADLVEAIEQGKVKGACLDVLEYESLSFEAMDAEDAPAPLKFLLNSDKVVLSPHIAGWTHESNYKMSKIVAEKMNAVLSRY